MEMSFAEAIESALTQAMVEDERVFVMGEDVQLLRVNLFVRFGRNRVRNSPISESAFLGAGVGAAMAGLRPVVEIMLIDFIGVAMDTILNHTTKINYFSGGKWNVPLVIRASCGGGYGDGGQHEQCLWGWIAHIPGIKVVVPSNPADAGGLMLAAIQADDPVIYFEHKLLSDYWRDYLGSGGRNTVSYDVPKDGVRGLVSETWSPIPIGTLRKLRDGDDVTLASVGVGVHRCLEAAQILEKKGIDAEILDLRSIVPLDLAALKESVEKTGKIIVVDEDYKYFGLSGEICASLLEERLSFKYGRICTEHTIPYDRKREDETLPNIERIVNESMKIMSSK